VSEETKLRDSATWLRLTITVAALLIAVCHLLWPRLALDTITLALVLIAVLPWLALLFKSLEIPGWLKVEFLDVKRKIEEVKIVADEVKTVANVNEQKITLIAQLQKLMFLHSETELQLERFSRNEQSLQRAVRGLSREELDRLEPVLKTNEQVRNDA
jgi:hypothetical protein